MPLNVTPSYDLSAGLTNELVIPPGTPIRSIFIHEAPEDVDILVCFSQAPGTNGPVRLRLGDTVELCPPDGIDGLTVTVEAVPGATLSIAYSS